jgi:hypothetical protein
MNSNLLEQDFWGRAGPKSLLDSYSTGFRQTGKEFRTTSEEWTRPVKDYIQKSRALAFR